VNMTNQIAPYAVTEENSRGRLFAQAHHPYRTSFERDRDRIMHSAAFRRLEGKTQVFMPGVNDHYRTRLTHTIEVTQIGRTIAVALNVNEALTEAICLGHDLGHSPFGHTGEKILNDIMASFGGFEHNSQSLRIVDLLEHPYADFTGLNLNYETRLGLAKHHSPYDNPQTEDFPEPNCSLEGQIADIADRIAYNCHDLDDGLRSALICADNLMSLSIFAEAADKINASAIVERSIRTTRTIKTIIDILVSDCITTSKKNLAAANIKSLDDVYNHGGKLITISPGAQEHLKSLEAFLVENLYNNKALLAIHSDITKWLNQVFDKLCESRDLMPDFYQRLIPAGGLQRTACYYLAVITDRFCL
jgi:dGTPase